MEITTNATYRRSTTATNSYCAHVSLTMGTKQGPRDLLIPNPFASQSLSCQQGRSRWILFSRTETRGGQVALPMWAGGVQGGDKTDTHVDKYFQCTVKEGGGRQVHERGREEAQFGPLSGWGKQVTEGGCQNPGVAAEQEGSGRREPWRTLGQEQTGGGWSEGQTPALLP